MTTPVLLRLIERAPQRSRRGVGVREVGPCHEWRSVKHRVHQWRSTITIRRIRSTVDVVLSVLVINRFSRRHAALKKAYTAAGANAKAAS